MPSQRIACIDGLRGVAILCVMLYHAFARWPGLVTMPFGQAYAAAFGWGWLGVELFFIVSGFVICMTLDRCSSFGEFMGKRWLRLFPAMLLASLLIFATAGFVDRPAGIPKLSAIVPGLTFIDPKWWAFVHGPTDLEGSFWSLYAEMKFYVFAGATYFLLGRRWVIAGLLSGLAIYWVTLAPHLGLAHYALFLLDVPYWAWFACGALFYESYRSGRARAFWAAVLVGAIASIVPVPGVGIIPNMEFVPLLGFPLVLLFAGALTRPSIQRCLSNRFLLFVGFISYPLYLIHEQAMIGIIRELPPWLPAPVLFVVPAGILMGAAYGIAKYGEPSLRRFALFSAGDYARAPARHLGS